MQKSSFFAPFSRLHSLSFSNFFVFLYLFSVFFEKSFLIFLIFSSFSPIDKMQKYEKASVKSPQNRIYSLFYFSDSACARSKINHKPDKISL